MRQLQQQSANAAISSKCRANDTFRIAYKTTTAMKQTARPEVSVIVDFSTMMLDLIYSTASTRNRMHGKQRLDIQHDLSVAHE